MARLSLIVAVARNGVIGIDNRLPWHLPGDLQWFKQHTMGKPMIMGRKTYESLGRPLPGRPHIVISRQGFQVDHERVQVVASIGDAFALAEQMAADLSAEEVMLIGGDSIYRACLPRVERIYRTLVELSPEGDAHFPDLNPKGWQLLSEKKNSHEGIDYAFQILEAAGTV